MSAAAEPTRPRALRAAASLPPLAALPLGAASATVLAPLHFFPAGIIAFGGLFLLLMRTRSLCGAWLVGWLFGVGGFAVSLSWITEAFNVDAERFGALALPALTLLASGLALFPACAALAARWLAGGRGGLALGLSLVACWMAAEWLRGVVLTGFPWSIVGYGWGFADAGLQAASLAGIHGLGLLAMLAWVLPAVALATRSGWPMIAAVLVFLLPLIWGALRLAGPAPADVPGIRLRLVQPNIAQEMKWEEGARERILERLLTLSATPSEVQSTHIVWPESAVPYLIAEAPFIRAEIAAVIPPGGALLTGAVRRSATTEGAPAMLNSILVLDGEGTIVASYDKIRLVPFGEYQPMRAILSSLPKLTAGSIDFIPGPLRVSIASPGLPPAWPLICYEAIFPAPLPAGQRPGWILTVTNDAWFGTSWGPYQHALAARTRAVELGLPMIRVANSGITFIADAVGRQRASLPLGTEGILEGALPGALPAVTIYARFGDIPFGIAMLLLSGIALVVRGRA